jgi:hypothetical protein
MKTLADAWGWYQCNRRQLTLLQRLGRKHWELLAALPSIARDDKVPGDAGNIAGDSLLALAPLDDLAVLVLFSVFESIVRQELKVQVEREVSAESHPVVRSAVDDALQGIDNGSFYNNVLARFKGTPDADSNLIEHVNQVRKYRNYVAHGKRRVSPESVSPDMAYERLRRFLTMIGINIE